MTLIDRVYLARHGRTALNAEGRLRGLSDPPLDDVGRAEAGRLAAVLAAKHPTRILSSPLQRAVATAQAIAREAGLVAVVDERLNDRDYGPWTGAVKSDVVRQFGSIDAAPGVESSESLSARVVAAFTDIVDETDDGPLVLVSHDAVNRALLAAVDTRLTDVGQRTACWNQLSRLAGVWRVDLYDQKPGQCDDPAIAPTG
ncbi:histidine phosphatase family protein [Mycobacterium sp. MBM]|nr:histidine phosphatase family protein [Mycobacterium sp. MBM]